MQKLSTSMKARTENFRVGYKYGGYYKEIDKVTGWKVKARITVTETYYENFF